MEHIKEDLVSPVMMLCFISGRVVWVEGCSYHTGGDIMHEGYQTV
jgi:hypothetical protein